MAGCVDSFAALLSATPMNAQHRYEFQSPRNCDQFYRSVLLVSLESDLPFLVGGAAAFGCYTGILRDTKDIDLFIRREDCERFLEIFAALGYRTEFTFPHWLAKVYCHDHFLDLIFSSGNCVAKVDDDWFAHAIPGRLWGVDVQLAPPEEMIWSKAYVQERERFDGADIMHLLHARGETLDWQRLLSRFGDHWRVLLGHLVTFGFVYPADRGKVPPWVMQELMGRIEREDLEAPQQNGKPLCRGTLLSREQYLFDIDQRGFLDGRLREQGGGMNSEDIAHWTSAIRRD